MNLDVVSNDELHPGQAHPVAGNGGQAEGFFRIAHVHQHLSLGLGQVRDRGFFHFKRNQLGIDLTDFALGAGDCDRLPGL